jgi:isopenicillin-N N-acyltransferase like protein
VGWPRKQTSEMTRQLIVQPIDVIEVAGEARARGRAFGVARKGAIHSCLKDWLGSLSQAGIADTDAHLSRMLRETSFLPAIREHTPDLLEEVTGIAEGADEPFERVLASQYMDEEWAFRLRLKQATEVPEKCSSVAVRCRSGSTIIGQNMDLGGYTDGHQVVIRIAPAGPEPGALIFTVGSMIALMGVNSRSVAVCVNSLPELSTAREGLPVAFVIRRLLQASRAEEAARLVQTLPHATGQHYLIADEDSIRSLEASPEGVVEYHSMDSSRVLHTNHPLAAPVSVVRDQTNTLTRLKSLTARLATGSPDLSTIQAALSSSDDAEHPVCRIPRSGARPGMLTGMIGFTTGTMISTLDRGSLTVESWVSAGPPSLRGFNRLELQKRA